MASEQITHLTDDTFDAEINNGVTLVDFWAPWCGPCRAQGPILEKVAARVGGKARIAKVNVDEAGGLAVRFGIRSIPTLILFSEGKPVRQFVGVQAENDLVSEIESLA